MNARDVNDTATADQREHLAEPRDQREHPAEPRDQREMPGEPRDQRELTTADIARSARAEASQQAAPAARKDADMALFPAAVSDDFRARWTDIQTGFVDTPREAVEQADKLVAEAIQRLADSFAREREGLEAQWSRHGDVSTEDLRVALQRYRAFFQRLLQV